MRRRLPLIAAILLLVAASIDPLAFSRASRPPDGRDLDRVVTVVDGRQAVRLDYQTTGDGLCPAGTPITARLVDVSRGHDEDRTLFVNTIGADRFDYDTNVAVLDRMARTLELTDPDLGAYAFHDTVAELQRLTLYDIDRQLVRTVEPGHP